MSKFKTAVKAAIIATLKQGKQSISDSVCMYRGGGECGELKCVIGHMITDEYYLKRMEVSSIDSTTHESHIIQSAVSSSIGIKPLTRKQVAILKMLQTIHDGYNSYNPSTFNEFFIKSIQSIVSYNNLPKYCLDAIKQYQKEIK